MTLNFWNRVYENARRRRLFRDGDSILLAVSGGPDSVVMLDFFSGQARKHRLKLSLCHINHKLRGRLADADARLAEAYGKFDGMAQAMQTLLNECMKIERQQALGVGPYQRGEARHGQANGFKPKTIKTRVGPLALAVPQVRGASFYPSSLERGSRSEKALRLALAEIGYIKSVIDYNTAQIELAKAQGTTLIEDKIKIE